MSPRRCLVAVCHNWPVLYRQTAQSLMELGWGDRVEEAKAAHGFAEISFAWYTGWPRVDALRDQAALDALREGFTHVIYLDADMVWPTDLLTRLLAHHDRGIVAGLYVLKAPPYSPVALRDGFQPEGSRVRQFFHDLDYGTEPREVEVVGMGCTVVPVAIFAAIGPRPWFAYADDDEQWPRVTEDVGFCLRARAAGFKVWWDPTIKCGHVGVQIVDERWHRRYQAGAAETSKRVTVRAGTMQAVEA